MTATSAFTLRPHSQAGLGRVAAGPGRRTRAREAFRPISHGRPQRPTGRSLGPISGPLMCIPFFISEIYFGFKQSQKLVTFEKNHSKSYKAPKNAK
jgi:hypothetical protein